MHGKLYRLRIDILTVYSASGDAEGTDANVTNLRAVMNGTFQPKTGATAPNFSLKFRVLVK